MGAASAEGCNILLQNPQAKEVILDAKLTCGDEEREKMPGASIEEIDQQRKQDEKREEELGLGNEEGASSSSAAPASE
jgi:hypothetical protein